MGTKRKRDISQSVDLEFELSDTPKKKQCNCITTKRVPLTVDNVVTTLKRVKIAKDCWQEKLQWCCQCILMISSSKLNKLMKSCSTQNESLCYQFIVRYWLTNYPYASWRELIDKFEFKMQHELADDIRINAEQLTDKFLTLENVNEVLKTVDMCAVGLCLKLPPNVVKCISSKVDDSKSDEIKKREKLISYWLASSPYANWEELSGKLYNRKERRALEKTMKYLQRTPEPTLTPSRLFEVFKDVDDSKSHAGLVWTALNIPETTVNEIKRQHPTDSLQRIRTLCKVFLEHHPAPCWEKVAYAFYIRAFYDANCYDVVEHIQSKYLKGTSEMRRLFKESMMFGHIVSRIVKVLLIGGPGVGKTSTKAVILGEDPPETYLTTPLAMRAIKVYQVDTSDPTKWVELSSKDRMCMISKAIRCCSLGSLSDLPKYGYFVGQRLNTQRKTLDVENMDSDHEAETSSPFSSSDHESVEESVTPESDFHSGCAPGNDLTAADLVAVSASTTDELLTFMEEDSNSSLKPIERISRVQITDSGGQHQFQELLPIFLKETSLYLFVQKLSEEMSAKGLVEYVNKQGEHVCKPYPASQSNLQIFQHCIRVLLSQKMNEESDIPHLMIVGTFMDKMIDCKETIHEKEEIVQRLLLPNFKDKVLYSNLYPKRVIFPLNAMNRGVEEARVAQKIRQVISDPEKCPVTPVEIPIQWHALEFLLEILSEKSGRDVLSRQECLSASLALLFNEESFDAALMFFESLNVIYYYSQLLPEVIFANTQVLLDKITELVELKHQLRAHTITVPLDRNWQRFHDYALVSVEFLSKHCSKHYIPGLFTAGELVRLFSGLSVFAKFNDAEYFVPALLHRLSIHEIAEKRDLVLRSSAIPAMVLAFPNDGPCLGVFCAMVVSLLSQQNSHPCPWELEMESDSITPTCLYRNCVKFTIPKPHSNGRRTRYPGTVMLIDAFTHFEVYLDLPHDSLTNLAKRLCVFIRHAVFDAIRSANLALHYLISDPNIGALCPCEVGESHIAEIDMEDKLMTCTKNTKWYRSLLPHQTVWCTVSFESINLGQPTYDTDEENDDEDIAAKLSTIDDKPLGDDDWDDVVEVLADKLIGEWRDVGRKLHIKPAKIDEIASNHTKNCKDCLSKVVQEWLQGNYSTTKYGEPSWRHLAKATSGLSMSVFRCIAREHQIKRYQLIS